MAPPDRSDVPVIAVPAGMRRGQPDAAGPLAMM
jgi:hypothetical protein